MILVLKMSKKRTPQPVIRYEDDQVHNKTWSEADKRVLLSGLKKHGHTDIKSLAKILPNKSPAAIKAMITSLMLAARRSTKENKIPPIDMWLAQSSIDETNSLIPQALSFISMFERHPRPEECGGCDLRAAYDYIYRMTEGHPMVAMPTKTRRIVYRVISKTVSKLRLKSPETLLMLINNLYKSTSRKDYTRRPQRPQKIGPCTLIHELNTFMVPSDQLRIS